MRLGMDWQARSGSDWLGTARSGAAGRAGSERRGLDWKGEDWLGSAGTAGRGEVRTGTARKGSERQAWLGVDRSGEKWQGRRRRKPNTSTP